MIKLKSPSPSAFKPKTNPIKLLTHQAGYSTMSITPIN